MAPYKRRSSQVSITSTHETNSSRLSPAPTTPGAVPVVRSPLGMPSLSTSRHDPGKVRSRSHSTVSMAIPVRSATTPTSSRLSRQHSATSIKSQSSSRRMSGVSLPSTPSQREQCEALLDAVAQRYAARRQFAAMKTGISELKDSDYDSESDSDADESGWDESKILELMQQKAALVPFVWANDFLWLMGRNIDSGSNALLQLRRQLPRCSTPDDFQAMKAKLEKMDRDLGFFTQATDYVVDCISEDKAGSVDNDSEPKTFASVKDIRSIINHIQRLQIPIKRLYLTAPTALRPDMLDEHMPFIQILHQQILNDFILARWALDRYGKSQSTHDRSSLQGVQTLYNRLVIRRGLYSKSLLYYGDLLARKGGKARR